MSNLSIKTNVDHDLNLIKASIYDLNLKQVLTNLENVIQNDFTTPLLIELIRASIDGLNLSQIISNLERVTYNNLTDSLLIELDKDINRIKKEDEKTFNFIFPINIHSIKCIDEFLKNKHDTFGDILNIFGIRLVDSNDYNFYNTEFIFGEFKDSKKRIKELMDYLRNPEEFSGLIFEVNINSNGLEYARKEAVRKMRIFLGLLSFSTYYLSTSKSYYSRFSKDRKLEISNISADIYFVFENRENLISPFYAYINEKGFKILLPDNIWQSKKEEFLNEIRKLPPANVDHCNITILEKIINIYEDNKLNTKLKNVLKDVLLLYYDACQEQMLDYSFLKFWVISELIIKKTENISDKTVSKKMLNVLKSNIRLPTEKFLAEEIYFLQQKRNALVHEGQIEMISQNDRNLSKLIADSTLRLFIDWIPEIKEMNGFSFVLSNLRQSYDNLDQYSVILTKLKTPNEFTINTTLNILKAHGYEIDLPIFRKELREQLQEDNDTIIDNTVKGLLNSHWIYSDSDIIKPTNKIILNYDIDVKFLSTNINSN